MPDKDELDLMLDSALATYADPGADSGLERRVLAALAADRAAAQGSRAAGWWRRWPVWAIAVPVAAALLLWVGVEKTGQGPSISSPQAYRSDRPEASSASSTATESRPTQRNTKQHSEAKAGFDFGRQTARLKSCPVTELSPPSTAEQAFCRETGRAFAVASAGQGAPPLPRLDVFPTPQPLTPQESALAVVAMQSPAPVREALVKAQIQDDAPITIAAIHIPPIKSPIQTQP